MKNNKQADKKSEYALLIEGAKSYPQALAALSEFRALVVDECRRAFEADITSLSKALGVNISGKDLLERYRPDNPKGADAMNAEIGIRIDRGREGWKLRYSLTWTKNPRPELWAQLLVRTGRDRAHSIGKALDLVQRKPQFDAGVDGSIIYVSRRITPDQMKDLPQIFHALNLEGVRIWQAVGGFKKWLKKKAKK
jgi:hypothetical protein